MPLIQVLARAGTNNEATRSVSKHRACGNRLLKDSIAQIFTFATI
jgi:hypothetical protein